MKLAKPEALGQSNEPLAPPVLMMYFLPALTNCCTLLASRAGVIPAQVSEPQVPVAKAQVKVELGMACVTSSDPPATVVCCAPVFQLASTVTSLYGLKTKPGALPPPPLPPPPPPQPLQVFEAQIAPPPEL